MTAVKKEEKVKAVVKKEEKKKEEKKEEEVVKADVDDVEKEEEEEEKGGKKAGDDAPPVNIGWDSHQPVVSARGFFPPLTKKPKNGYNEKRRDSFERYSDRTVVI